jgi:hypothetical protein
MKSLVDIVVPDEAYDASGWDGDLSAPTKNAIRDKLESGIAIGTAVTGGGANRVLFEDASQNLAAVAGFTYAAGKLVLNDAEPHLALVNTEGGSSEFRFRNGAIADSQLDIYNHTSTTSFMRFAGSTVGRVGIGPDAIPPQSTLFVSNAHTGGTNLDVRSTDTSLTTTVDVQMSTYESDLRSAFLQVANNSVSTAIDYLTGIDAAGRGTLTFGDIDGVIRTVGSKDLIFGTNFTERLRITGAGAITAAVDITVPDEAYDATAWNGSLEVPTKNAVRDKIESLSAGSGISRTIVVTSGSATMGSAASTDYVYFIAGAHTMSLPAASGNTNQYTVKNNHSANVTIDTAGAETVEGAASISIAPEEAVVFFSDNTNWWIV